MLKILPQQFYQVPEIKKIMVDGLSCIIHKEFVSPTPQKEGYVSTHAITLVRKGTLKVENDAGPLTYVQAGQMIFLPKGLYMISDIIPDQGAFEAVVFFFEEDVINNFINSINLKSKKEKCVTHLVLEYTNPVKIFTEALLQLYSGQHNTHKALTKTKLFELLHLIAGSQPSECFLNALATLNNKEKKSLRAFMEANFSNPLGIADYAYLTGRSLSSFRRDFINQFGTSPKQWLIDKRLEHARELLKKNHTTVSQVALSTGYENMSHFIKAFHHKYGMPPKQFLMQRRREVLV
jgi:AraC family transcriptional regulator, exoenzyme S synthesis regulatory protein ExsA